MSPTSDAVMQPLDVEELWDAIGRLLDRDLQTLTPDEFVDLALAVPPLLPRHFYRRIIEYRRRAPDGDVLLLHGFLPSHVIVPSTVTTS